MTLPYGDQPRLEQAPADLAAENPAEDSGREESPVESGAVAPGEETDLAPPPQPLVLEEPPLFASFIQPEVRPPARIPHLGHVLLVLPILLMAAFITRILASIALYFHFGGVSTPEAATNNIAYTLVPEGLIYLLTLAGCLISFPPIWHRSLFQGLQWNGITALHLRWQLMGAGFVCFVLAILNLLFIPGPSNTPIEKVFKEPGAAWFLFLFGITFAPFFEELFFRGFLLPALCTAYDWLAERIYHVPRRPMGPDDEPRWSLSAMVIASCVTSAPFALMHAEQTGNSVDAVLLLACVSLVLCAVRLFTRSLASSVFVHSFYNFLLFSMMLLGTEGFKHLDKM
ncbi:MAG TPA: type II CAAX endopeptidase family protein [Terracidiphilus sp.]|nr:type II CAAX endopeptidase family protein [Terracidiphilus sp.]